MGGSIIPQRLVDLGAVQMFDSMSRLQSPIQFFCHILQSMNYPGSRIARHLPGAHSITLVSILCIGTWSLVAPSSLGSGADALSIRLINIQARLPQFKHQLDDLKAKGQDISYPLVSDTVLENFTAYALEDLGIRTPSGWGMIAVNGAAASAQVVKDAHSGQWAIEIANHTPRQPNVYGMLECRDVISLQRESLIRSASGRKARSRAWLR